MWIDIRIRYGRLSLLEFKKTKGQKIKRSKDQKIKRSKGQNFKVSPQKEQKFYNKRSKRLTTQPKADHPLGDNNQTT